MKLRRAKILLVDGGWILRFIFSAIFLMLAVLYRDLADFVIRTIRFPVQVDYGEGCTLTFLNDFIQNGGKYFYDGAHYPFSYAAYPPLFFVASAAVHSLFPTLLVTTRIVSVVSTVSLLIALYLLLKKLIQCRMVAFCLTAFFPLFWCIKVFFPIGRIDFFTMLFVVVGLLLHEQSLERNGWRRAGAFFFFALALFSKQNAILAPFAILLDSFLSSERRKYFFPNLLIYLGLIAALFVPLFLWTNGAALKNLFTDTFDRKWLPSLFWGRGLSYLKEEFALMFSLALLGVLSMREWRLPSRVYAFYFILNVPAFFSLGFTGANLNYLIEPLISMLLMVASYFNRWVGGGACSEIQRHKRFLMIAGILLFQVLLIFSNYQEHKKNPPPWMYGERFESIRGEGARLTKLIQETKGDILSEEFSLMVLNHKPIFLGCASPKVEEGRVFFSDLIDDCKKKRFKLIIAGRLFMGLPGFKQCLDARYSETPSLPGHSYRVFRPQD